MKQKILVGSMLLCALACSTLFATAQKAPNFQTPAWTRPFPPFQIAGNLYYVGSEDLAAYLITTPQGSILINSNLESSVSQIRESVEKLGFKFSDIKILLISHSHYDHCAGSGAIIKQTGAKYYVMDADASVAESGGKTDFAYSTRTDFHFPPTHVDRALHDGDAVTLGGVSLIAHLTPGHTKGTTTWTMDEVQGGRTLRVVIVGSPNVNEGYKLVDNKQYPKIAEDYKKGFQILKDLPCDIFLGAHGGYFGLTDKYPRWKNGDKNAFIDPAGYKSWIADRERAFEAALAKQQTGKS